MNQYTRRPDILARSAAVCIGIDIHKYSWHVTALVNRGHWRRRLETAPLGGVPPAPGDAPQAD